MKSVGEVLALGRTFKEALQKGLRGLETDAIGFFWERIEKYDYQQIEEGLRLPNSDRLYFIRIAFENDFSVEKIQNYTQIDSWFLNNMADIFFTEKMLRENSNEISMEIMIQAKRMGFSDHQIAIFFGKEELEIRDQRKKLGVYPTYKLVDTCAAEFAAVTPYYYSTYETEDEVIVNNKPKVMIVGGGPNRIGQGIEFDYCCCQASFALRMMGYQSVMVNCNPETVSTDYDTSDRLYFEPLTVEDVANVYEKEKPIGVILQFGGQTPLNIAHKLESLGIKILGTPTESIDTAEDRGKFSELISSLQLKQPKNGVAYTGKEVFKLARRIGYPVLLRPSYVLGGRAMEIVYDDEMVEQYLLSHWERSNDIQRLDAHPILVDQFLEGAIEIDVDVIGDGNSFIVAGIMQHIEEAGIHSGDSACCLPPHSLDPETIEEITKQSISLAKGLNICGLMNIQFAICENEVVVLEVNPRASRTIPFVSKTLGLSLAHIATQVMCGKQLSDIDLPHTLSPKHYAVKEVVLPFSKFHGVEVSLGPEMKSTGEVMGIDDDFGRAFAKAQAGAGCALPRAGTVFLSVRDDDKLNIVDLSRILNELGFDLVATAGTCRILMDAGISVQKLSKLGEEGTNVVDLMMSSKVQLVVNTPSGKRPRKDENYIRTVAIANGVPCVTTIAGARASVLGIKAQLEGDLAVWALQDI